jgi:hypothetical protein
MSSLYKGLGDVYGPKSYLYPTSKGMYNFEKVKYGQVLDVILDDSSDYYGSDIGIGAIRFRLIPDDYKKSENQIQTFALPADRSHFKIPLPGEQVLIYPFLLGQRAGYLYGPIVEQDFNSTYNSQPFTATAPKYVDQDTLLVAVDEKSLATRFEKKLHIPLEAYKNAAMYVTNAREGDTIIRGRFGSLIRFTSTMEKIVNESFSEEPAIGGDILGKSYSSGDGDPIVILQASRIANVSRPSTIQDTNINTSDASVYLTSNQVIPIQLACSKTLYSWNVNVITGKNVTQTVDEATARLSAFFPDGYDPNEVFTINLNVTFVNGGAGIGPGGGNTPAQAITPDIKDFGTVVATVIDKLEGGYYHPDMLKDGRVKDSRYGSSGETMMGIDRVAGGTINTTETGKQFWSLIDNVNARSSWTWGYRGGELESQLRTLAGQIIYPVYNRNSQNYLSSQARALVESDGRLLFNFIYASWNGSGWFKKFASDMNEAVASGVTDTNQLCRVAINSRVNEGLTKGSEPNSLIAQGGKKIAGIIGVSL